MMMQTDELTQAERELLELVRHRDAKNFTVAISTDLGRWHIKLEDHDAGVAGDGRGPDFDTAWGDIVDPRLRGPHLHVIK
jgi:hypothetical protein